MDGLETMNRIRRRCGLLLSGAAGVVLVVLAPLQPAGAAPEPDGGGNVGTAVHVVMHNSFTQIPDADQCVGTADFAAIHRDASLVLSEASSYSADTSKVAVGRFFRSRMKDGNCEVLYVISAPAMPAFNVQFYDAAGSQSSTYGPFASEPVADQPGILQAVRVDLGV
jgi:hypothetical protein